MTTSSSRPLWRSPRRAQRRPLERGGRALDERFGPSGPVRHLLNKVFPDNWSFMLGEIALYSFIILILTGTYLALFFDPSMGKTTYHGSYAPLDGLTMSHAYSSTVRLSFDVRGGLIMRQIHHWAALMFVASIIVHMCRIFFTGAFRKPRETNWIIGVTLLLMGIVEGFCGYSLPDDLMSGTGLRIMSAVTLSIPVVGTWLTYLIFGGEFPGTQIIGRLYIVHVLLIPGIILALVSIHLALVVKQKHTQFPGPGRTEHNVVGERVMPTYAAKSGAFFTAVFGVLALLGGLAQINPIWLWGPYEPAQVGAGSQPDFYMLFLEGSLRLFPSWGIHFSHYTLSVVFWPAVVLPMLLFGGLYVYPFVEARLTRDRVHHNLLQRPRDVPVRTGIGAMALTFYVVLTLAGSNDIIALVFDVSLNATIWGGRILLLLLPPLAYWTAYRICLGLQRHDREVLEEGIETGIIRAVPYGGYVEVHQPLGPTDEHGEGELRYAGAPVPKKVNSVRAVPRRVIGFFRPIEMPAEQPIEPERSTEVAVRDGRRE